MHPGCGTTHAGAARRQGALDMYDLAVLLKEDQPHLPLHNQQELKPVSAGYLWMPMRANIRSRLEGDEYTLHPFRKRMERMLWSCIACPSNVHPSTRHAAPWSVLH